MDGMLFGPPLDPDSREPSESSELTVSRTISPDMLSYSDDDLDPASDQNDVPPVDDSLTAVERIMLAENWPRDRSDSNASSTSRPSPVLRLRSAENNTASTSHTQNDDDTSNDTDDHDPTNQQEVNQPTTANHPDDQQTANNETKTRKSDNSNEPPSKIRKVSDIKDEDLDGETCPICLESWANSGMHRLVALKCGHLFGYNCVERWLKAKLAKDRNCPTCKTKANIKDIRHIFARRLVAADSSEITVLQNKVEQLQTEKNRVELELQKSRISHRACLMQLEVLRSTLMKSQGQKEAPVRKHWRFALEKNLEMSRDGGCRVLTYNCRTYEFYVSQKSSNNIFPGYGIRKVSCVDYKPGQFMHLHSKCIRDMTYSTQRDLLLSVGLDNTAKIVERGILTTTIQAGCPLWSCSWDHLRTNEFYVGGVGGQILQYDVRNPSTYLQRLLSTSDLSPVASLKSTEFGLLSCQLNSCWLWVSTQRLVGLSDQYEPRSLPIDGPFISLTYDEESHRALIACRPLVDGGRSRLSACKLRTQASTGEIIVDHEQTFPGSIRTTLMSRPAWVKAPGASWVAAHSESDSTLYLHGLEGARTMSLPAAEPAVDVASVQLNGDTILAALSQQRLRLYKAVPTNS